MRRSLLRASQPTIFLRAALFVSVTLVLLLAQSLAPARAQNAVAELPLPDEVETLLDTEPLPQVAVDPARRYALLVHERKLLDRQRLAEPAVQLAGRRIELRSASAYAPLDYYGLTLIDLFSGQRTAIKLPRDAVIGFPMWAPDGSKFAFTLSRSLGTELWIGDPARGYASKLAGAIKASHGSACSWMADSRSLLCETEVGWRDRARAATTDTQTLIEVVTQQASLELPVVLSDQLVRSLLEAQLELIDTTTGGRYAIGSPAAFDSVRPAPSGIFFVVTRIAEPYPRVSGVDATVRLTEIWDRRGNVVRRLPAEARAVAWHASQAATLTWIERRAEADRLMLLQAPYGGAAVEAFVLPNTFSGLRFIGDANAALVSDYDGNGQRTDLWHVSLDASGENSHVLTSYPSSALQSPLMGTNRYGMPAVIERDGRIYWHGERSRGEERYRFLDLMSVETGEAQELWADQASAHEQLIDVLSADGRFLLVRGETGVLPPNYQVLDQASGERAAITRYEPPVPLLADARRIRLDYHRDDGLELGATLYLPPDYTGGSALPAILWAYPRQVVAVEDSTMMEGAERFPTFERAFRLFFLLQGYAVLDDVSMPIVGSDSSANDTFIQQVIANASAAIAAAQGTGYVDATRVGVAGHSYGAFMVANLLAHSRLFAAGAALSGAYNRTLTPFGFQTERRTLWEAPDTYLAMSPLLFSHQIEAPLLLVHGLNDDNAGTSPLQSTQLYSAILGNGGEAELLLLPWEGHSYRARESVLDTAAHMLRWFDRNLKGRAALPLEFGVQKETGAFLRP
jgi:dipeptidyl aminopeptidase/acylaminoacyl peptidase